MTTPILTSSASKCEIVRKPVIFCCPLSIDWHMCCSQTPPGTDQYSLFPTPPVELWQWLDQPQIKLEQSGSDAILQKAEATIRRAALAPIRGG